MSGGYVTVFSITAIARELYEKEVEAGLLITTVTSGSFPLSVSLLSLL